MTTRLNPFPDYTVARLGDKSPKLVTTVPTDAVKETRTRVDQYLSRLSTRRGEEETHALLNAVRGDFGSREHGGHGLARTDHGLRAVPRP